VPLAIELAAARVGSLPVEDIAARLHDRFRLLSGGGRDLPPRQRTLRAALDWSWDLLEDAERAQLRRLAVFACGWTLAAAEAVLGAGAGAASWAVLDGLDSLVRKSLVQVDETGEEAARYRLLETVHAYAGERLTNSEDAAPMRDRHLAWCVALAQEAAPRLTGPDQAAWLAQLTAEHENLRAALAWAQQQGEAALLLQLAAALWRFWYLRGYLSEGRTWLAAALSLAVDAPAAGDPRARAPALHGAGVLAWTQGDHVQAVALAEQALEHWQAQAEQARVAPTLNLLGLVAIDQGDWARATTALEESLSLYRARGDRWGIATALHNLGTVARRQGDHARAATLYEESQALRRTVGDDAGMAIAYLDQGLLAVEQGESERAVTCFRAGLAQAAALGDAVRLAQCLEGLALVAALQDRAATATQFLGAAVALRERIQAPIAPADQAEREQLMASLRRALGPAFAGALAAGQTSPWEQLVESAFAAGLPAGDWRPARSRRRLAYPL
jgi:tetratricopeptide (TPR) repeat protein